ncbi:hypothetical protein TrRE_jg11660, partial [Triparma retinervis]
RTVTSYGCVSFSSSEECGIAVELGKCIEIGRQKLLCQRRIFPTLEHHRAIYWGEEAEVPSDGSVKPYIAAKVAKVKTEEEDERPKKKSRWGNKG